jgi:hypothetical protein
MLTSAVIRAGELLAVVLAAGTVTLAAGLWWLKRRVRRLRRAGLAAARMSMAAATAGRHRLWSAPLPDRRWLAEARQRRRLWRAVAAAEHAVAAARQAGAPAGDLDGLCRRLRQAAGDADRSLAVSRTPARRGEAGHASGPEVSEVLAAAGLIQDAAASALASMARHASASLAGDARREAAALSAGIAAAARAGHRGEPG